LGIIYAYSNLLKLPIQQRFDICSNILKTEPDESLRVEAIWVIGNMLEEQQLEDSLREKIEDLLADVLKNDENVVVKHEAGYQIGEHYVQRKLPALIESALTDPSELVRHESIEAIGLLEATAAKEDIKKALKDQNEAVRQTAQFVIKQLERFEKLNAVETA
jgi:HEAT repeat protein